MLLHRTPIDEAPSGYLEPWQSIDRYEPCFELAAGGMATVFLARVTARAGIHRYVALKRIHPHLVREPGFIDMFLDEAHVASRIVHPNVCSVFDYDARADRPYIAMEYLMGEPLSRVSHALARAPEARVPRACRMIARIIADACEGLHAAHELRSTDGEPLDVVHRDVSPQNLFVTYDGAVKVVDFGLVRMAQCIHKTKTGILKGKFGYLAPEAIAMKLVDRRADVWGLGVVLWELVTGQRLFHRDSEVDTLLAVTRAEVPLPSIVRAGVPDELDAIVLRALARDPVDRYPNARLFGRDLMRFIHGGAEPVGLSDLADWMEELFPGGRVRKLELLEIAGQLKPDRLDSPPSARASSRPAPLLLPPALPASMPCPSPPSDLHSATPSSATANSVGSLHVAAPRRPRHRSTAIVAAALAVFAAGGAATVLLTGRWGRGEHSDARDGLAEPESNTPARGTTRAGLLGPVPGGPAERTNSAPPPNDTSRWCESDPKSFLLEIVPSSEGGPQRLLLRPAPRESPRP